MEWLYFIGRNVPSSKNSKTVTKQKKVISSRLCTEYRQVMGALFLKNLREWKKHYSQVDGVCYVGFYFYRDSRRHWDFVNIVQIIADMMQDYLYVDDDDTKHFIPVYLGEEVVPKEKSGFKMKILDNFSKQVDIYF